MKPLFKAGYISKVHGIKGELKARFDVEDIAEFKKEASLFLFKNGKPTLFTVLNFRILSPEEVILSLKEITDRNVAESWKGAEVQYPSENLPQRNEDDFFLSELIGFRVQDEKLGTLGLISEVIEKPVQNLLSMNMNGTEVLIPIDDAIVLRADHDQKTLFTCLPDGLLEVYTTPGRSDEEEE